MDEIYKIFLRGELKQSQDQSHLEVERYRNSDPEWAWKFRLLEAESLLLRGFSRDTLALLNSHPSPPRTSEAVVQTFALKGIAYARLHTFSEAEANLDQAERLCAAASEPICGTVIRARGVLANERGQLEVARKLFQSTLAFARTHGDHFLEATALLNLGVSSLNEEHFDEAVDLTEAALTEASAIDAGGVAAKALGNLGWAYYNLGDSEKSLDFSKRAVKRSLELSNVIDQLSYLGNTGYVYRQRGDFGLAKQSYAEALRLATGLDAKQHIYNAVRALALVSLDSGDIEGARHYSHQAIVLAQENRLSQLYPLMVKGQIAARLNDDSKAESIFREIEGDPAGNASLKWRSENALAMLYANQNRGRAADREYRAALSTFERARSSLRRSDAQLPFSANGSQIYDNYISFLIAHNRSDDALRWADHSRARTLTEGMGLLTEQGSRPSELNPRQIARRARSAILFYWLGEKQSYLWVITPQKIVLSKLPAAPEIEASVERYSKSLTGMQDVLTAADKDGRWLYSTLIAPAQSILRGSARVFVIPDGKLNRLNFETLLVPETTPGKVDSQEATLSQPKLHYLIEDITIANASSIRILGAATRSARKPEPNLLLIGDSVAANDTYPELAKAASQMEHVARHFSAQTVFQREQATPSAYLEGRPEMYSYIHFVAHGTDSRLSPLDSAIVLSKSAPSKTGDGENSFKLYARDIIRHPLTAKLVTISACYGAGERTYSGEGLVGLSWAFLRAGAHNVIAALWDATDSSTDLLMDKFYDGLREGAAPEIALRIAKLSLLHNSGFRNPYYWGPFQLYGHGEPEGRFTSSRRQSEVRERQDSRN